MNDTIIWLIRNTFCSQESLWIVVYVYKSIFHLLSPHNRYQMHNHSPCHTVLDRRPSIHSPWDKPVPTCFSVSCPDSTPCCFPSFHQVSSCLLRPRVVWFSAISVPARHPENVLDWRYDPCCSSVTHVRPRERRQVELACFPAGFMSIGYPSIWYRCAFYLINDVESWLSSVLHLFFFVCFSST